MKTLVAELVGFAAELVGVAGERGLASGSGSGQEWQLVRNHECRFPGYNITGMNWGGVSDDECRRKCAEKAECLAYDKWPGTGRCSV